MFPPTITGRPRKRSLRELVREAVDTAAEFAVAPNGAGRGWFKIDGEWSQEGSPAEAKTPSA